MRNKDVWRYIDIASKIARLPDAYEDFREYRLASVGVRSDGALVVSRNGSAPASPDVRRIPNAHTEIRTLKKLNKNSILFVCRIGLAGVYRNSKPCPGCESAIRNSGKVKRVYYTISESEYGILDLTR